jgi:RNA polymerase primary sigma factor
MGECMKRQKTLDSYFKSVGSYKLLNGESERALAQKISQGDTKARDLMINSNLRLALSLANKYSATGYPVEELIQEANIGLIKAVDRFDYKKGFRFSTYAVWWIKQSLRRYLASQGHIKFPAGSRHLIWKINNVRKEYEEEFGVFPDDKEVSKMLDVKVEVVSNLRSSMKYPIDINSPVFGEEGRTWADTIEDNNSPDMDVLIDQKNLMTKIKEAFSQLTPQEERVLRLRFGIADVSNLENYKQL